jgi:hypothetical protein
VNADIVVGSPLSLSASQHQRGHLARREAGMKHQTLLEPSPTRECRKPVSDRYQRIVAVALALLLAIPSGGCSWIGITKPPSRPIDATPPVQCTTGVAAPVGDTIIGVLTVATGVALVAIAGSTSNKDSAGAIAAGVGAIALGATAGVSAGFGYTWTAECRELEEFQKACIAGVEASCAALRAEPSTAEGQDKPRQ